MLIRPYTPADLPALHAIRAAAFAPVFASEKVGFSVHIPSIYMYRKL